MTIGDLKREQSIQVQGHFRGIKIKTETAPEDCLEISDHRKELVVYLVIKTQEIREEG